MKGDGNQIDLDFETGNADGLLRWRSSVRPESTWESGQLNFEDGDEARFDQWRKENADLLTQLARKEGVPIGNFVRVVLTNQLELSGRLLPALDNDSGAMHFQVAGTTFARSEIVSCVKTD